MPKFSIKHLGLSAEILEKTNVMTPFNNIIYTCLPLGFLCLILVNLFWIKVFASIIISIVIISWIIIYITHSIKTPELLQSEIYRIEQHKIEAGMLSNKDENLIETETLTTNITPLLATINSEDKNE